MINLIDKQLNKLEYNIHKNPIILRNIQIKLKRIVHTVFNSFVSDDGDYCTKFKLPTTQIEKLYEVLHLDKEEIITAFTAQWKLPSRNFKMYGNIYYHNLLLLIIYGIRKNQKDISEKAFNILLFRLWNGRLIRAIKYCDSDTMNYVRLNVLNNGHWCKKYSTPFSLITEYFTISILKKYSDSMRVDSTKSKHFFNQSFNRLGQIFYQNRGPSLAHGGKILAKSGLAVHYYKAKEEGKRISTLNAKNTFSDEEVSFDERLTADRINVVMDDIVNFMVINYKTIKYESNIIEHISKTQRINISSINAFIQSIHNDKYTTYLSEIIVLILYSLKIKTRQHICDLNIFKQVIKRRIISSKHSSNIISLKSLIDNFITTIYYDLFNMKYNNYSEVRKSQLRNTVILLICYNIHLFICKK